MGESFIAPIEAIDGQAEYVNGVHGKARTADDAAGQIRTQDFDLAYGVLCQEFPQGLKPVEERTVDTIKRIVEALQHTTEGLKETARSYREAEQAVVASLEEILGDLGNQSIPDVQAGGPGRSHG